MATITDLSIGNLNFINNLWNASGPWCLNDVDMITIGRYPQISAVVSKTCTLEPFAGHPDINFIKTDGLYVNCMGVPNHGFKYYQNFLLQWMSEFGNIKHYVLSLDGSNLADLSTMLQLYNNFCSCLYPDNRFLVEINVSCPNKCDNAYARILGYDPINLCKTLESLATLQLSKLMIGLKLPPYLDSFLLHEIGHIIISSPVPIYFITCCNSIPNALPINRDTGESKLSKIVGGISGSPVNKLLAISAIYQLKSILPHIRFIGCGNVANEDDIKDYNAAGALFVQTGVYSFISAST